MSLDVKLTVLLDRFADTDPSTGQVKLTDTFADQTVSNNSEPSPYFY